MPIKLIELEVFILAEELSNYIWEIIIRWNYYEKEFIGKQLIRAADSISANLAECHGRYHYKDKQKFGYYARGSFEETKSWLRKCQHRRLLNNNQLMIINTYIKKIGPKLNSFINTFKHPRVQT
jgi:four helix bundle protein